MEHHRVTDRPGEIPEVSMTDMHSAGAHVQDKCSNKHVFTQPRIASPCQTASSVGPTPASLPRLLLSLCRRGHMGLTLLETVTSLDCKLPRLGGFYLSLF